MSSTTTKPIEKTGRRFTHFGHSMAEVSDTLSPYNTVEVEGVWYYTWDFGGVVVGSRTATSVDYGGNDVGRGERVAPTSTMGLAAPLARGAMPTRVRYGTPEICERQD